jgi:hypothetical protein
MTEERICRVLIVDNELEFAAQTASKLKEIRSSLLNHNQLQIELTNNAYFVAERLRLAPAGQPPWDIIISDVYMPFPNGSLNESVGNLSIPKEPWQMREWTTAVSASLTRSRAGSIAAIACPI